MVQVILIERIEKLGKIGDVVDVRPGYARNYLLPQNKAIRSTKENLASFEQRRSEIEAQDKEKFSIASTLADTLKGKEIILIRAASESGQLYGSVTARDIANEIQTQLGESINRSQVLLEVPVKTLGIFPQKIILHGDVTMMIDLNVAKTEDEAGNQRKAIIDAATKEKNKEAKRQADKLAKETVVEESVAEIETTADIEAETETPVEIEAENEAENEAES